ncbi:4-hydroxy-2-oxovalerate aldolase [Massilia dura]|uniref:4-hydroxy-2-oxovalerate aldolase n=1 Tax=Pseudoduganella dura TaxID=321982 RepID=A0A6I3XJ72_9BURK|nr:4-hydroxy-2-oxovalerate aldolase [Pseudoduganella dura]MUI13731.1 4-hydroxy-2-oxovalerate aldolase [Pseudoduganella dura]GGX75006.1 4-hydroxy-2-oxovalerate aldolase [Pseudoduganella dura]
MAKQVLISDPTLRDGNHAVRHQLGREAFAAYCKAAEAAGVPIVEVGHGNGLGASSLLVGEASLTDEEILAVAREHLRTTRLAIHVIPGFCTIKKDLSRAVELGVDLFRVASHCTEADITDRHIAYARAQGKEAWGVLMMSHMASPAVLLEEAKKMESYGAEAIVIMDSAGAYFPDDVRERIATLVNGLSIPVGFHGHNNLGMSVINSVAAVEEGASIIDGTIRGFGAGAGNTQLEVLVAVFQRMGVETGIDLYKILDAADIAEKAFNPVAPTISPLSIVSGLAGVFSGFAKPVARAAEEYQVDPRDIFFALGKRNAVAGQESLIIEVARDLAAQKG